jgi:hypothetical protein
MQRYQVKFKTETGSTGLRLVKAYSALHAMQLVQMLHGVLNIVDAVKVN